jgi:hypothetical protein
MSAMKIRERKVAKFYYKSVYLFISFLVYPCFFCGDGFWCCSALTIHFVVGSKSAFCELVECVRG